MTDHDAEAIEIASVIEAIITNTIATGNQPLDINTMADSNEGGNNNNKITFGCIDPNCGFVTTDCDMEDEAGDLLALHVDIAHKK